MVENLVPLITVVVATCSSIGNGLWALHLYRKNQQMKRTEDEAAEEGRRVHSDASIEIRRIDAQEARENRLVQQEEAISQALIAEAGRLREAQVALELKDQVQRQMIEKLSGERLLLELELTRARDRIEVLEKR